jgi:hypothetical protein
MNELKVPLGGFRGKKPEGESVTYYTHQKNHSPYHQ